MELKFEMKVADKRARAFYAQVYAAKYLTYMPTEEELKRELNLEEFERLDRSEH